MQTSEQESAAVAAAVNADPPARTLPSWLPVAAVLVPCLAACAWVEPYLANAAASWLVFGVLGLGLSLVWGQMGFLSLGQTAFYGLGAYAASIAAINVAPFMSNPMLVSVPAGTCAGAAAAAAIGWIVFYGRMGALQGTILTYTFTLVIWTVSVSFTADAGRAHIGGDNGIAEIPGFVFGFGENARPMSPNEMLATMLVVAAAAYLACVKVMASPLGRIIGCIRQNPVKTELLGYDIRRSQLVLFVIGGALSGLAGSLYCAWSAYVSPSLFSAQEAMLVPIYVLAGGLGSLAGAFAGSAMVGALSFWLGGGAAGGQATLVLGVCLMLLVLCAPAGLAGAFKRITRRSRGAALHAPAAPQVAIDAGALARTVLLDGRASNCEFEAHGLFKRFGGVTPVNHVSRRFCAGSAHALIGPNGAGKSSFLRCCVGLYDVDKGAIRMNDADLTRRAAFTRVRQGVGIKTQAPMTFAELSVHDNLWVAAYRPARDKRAADRAAAKAVAAAGLQQQAGMPAGSLPHGAQQWLDIAMVMVQQPGVLFLDEPAAGMTPQERRELAALLATLGRSMPVIVVEHDMDFVRTLGARVTVLHQGSVFAEGDIEALRSDERVMEIYLGKKHAARTG
jgi:branched-chain amino acid transport system permease protein